MDQTEKLLEDELLSIKFAKKVCDKVHEWMLETYPDFDKNLTQKIDALTRQATHLDLMVTNYKIELRREQAEFSDSFDKKSLELIQSFKKQIENFISTSYPDLRDKLTKTCEEIEQMQEKQRKTLKTIENKLEKLKGYNSICEDFYEMRDHMKQFEKTFSDWKTKMSSLFK